MWAKPVRVITHASTLESPSALAMASASSVSASRRSWSDEKMTSPAR